jgi:hypothetical protein
MELLDLITNDDLKAIEEIAKKGISISDLLTTLKGKSVYRILRRGVKSPSSSGMDNWGDDCYYDLYNIVNKLNKETDGK